MGAITALQARQWLRWMIASRLADRAEERLVRQGRGSTFQMSCGGHEALCVLQDCLTTSDWIYPHYRDRALLLARGTTQAELFAAFFATGDSSSGGRQMTAHFSAREQQVVSLSSPVGSSALHAVGTALALKDRGIAAVVLCLMGDATTQEGEVYEALAHAASEAAPVIFCIEDNGYGISTRTAGKTFWSRSAQDFLGIPIAHVDGSDAAALYTTAQALIAQTRSGGGPQVLVCALERLASHSSSDAQQVYRPAPELATMGQHDPLERWQEHCLSAGWVTPEGVAAFYVEAQTTIDQAIQQAEYGPEPHPYTDFDRELFGPQLPLPTQLLDQLTDRLAQTPGELTLRQVLADTLSYLLELETGTFLFGQDIEDPKGDVFGVTRGLSTRFGSDRVRNAPLAEATILGTAVGRAIGGQRPITFVQFIDFIGPGLNQLLNEVATLHWRTKGQWQCPLMLMAPTGGYRAGLGPWHSQTSEALFAHTPGLDVVMPATPLEAGYLLLKAFISQRPTLYLYPKAVLNQRFSPRDLLTRSGLDWCSPGRVETVGQEVTLIGWGNTVALCQDAALELTRRGISAEVLSLNTLSPLPMDFIARSVAKTQRVIVVHEDNQTCGLGAEILARLQENLEIPFTGRRVVRPDVHIPFHFGSQLSILPSVAAIVEAVTHLGTAGRAPTCPDLLPDFPTPPKPVPVSENQIIAVPVPRIAPSDEAATLLLWRVQLGETVTAGQPLADLEGDKAVFELEAPQAGIVHELLHTEGDSVRVAETVAYLLPLSDTLAVRPTPPKPTPRALSTPPGPSVRILQPRILAIGTYVPKAVITNEDLLLLCPEIPDVQWIIQRTGIHQRPIAPATVSVVEMGVAAARQALERAGLEPKDLNLIIVSTTTPQQIIPSTACQIQAQLGAGSCAAFDIFATCSGFLYALSIAQGALATGPHQNVMVITVEKMRTVLNPQDVGTSILFGDAATACILSHRQGGPGFILEDALIHAEADPEGSIVLDRDPGLLHMDGTSIFRTAVLKMSGMCEQIREKHALEWSLDRASPRGVAWVVPHQANIRILQALAKRLKISEKRIFSNIETLGNTSSSSIPLCLEQLQQQGLLEHGHNLLLCAVGGGVTYGGAYLRYTAH
ncbi:beta-ketoacyl-ACP synthase 3 [Anthocerotibacter panamensis]|uniref:beta-ketoacyl-ACP synthase 3 n=1 Tax=Anthocerotibacter panamensis TaxID=2857077 RepID=UPI001C403E6C|nr:beta-ketoacyl-ACP synthase 3 [Anthocerotibacter panamensis]